MEFGSLDDRDDGAYTHVGFAEISKVFETQNEFFYRAAPFDRVQINLVIWPGFNGNVFLTSSKCC